MFVSCGPQWDIGRRCAGPASSLPSLDRPSNPQSTLALATTHSLQDHFEQIGLPSEAVDIGRFVVAHRPLADAITRALGGLSKQQSRDFPGTVFDRDCPALAKNLLHQSQLRAIEREPHCHKHHQAVDDVLRRRRQAQND